MKHPERESLADLILLSRRSVPVVPDDPNARQRAAAEWVSRTFGPECMTDTGERSKRVLEEVAELCQAEGMPEQMAHDIVTYVYARPVGDIGQEIGGARLTLLAYAVSRGLSADQCERNEVERVLAMDPEYFKRRIAEKAAAGVSSYVAGE